MSIQAPDLADSTDPVEVIRVESCLVSLLNAARRMNQ